MNKLWKNYDAKEAYDGYFTKDNKLRKHASVISSILERYGKNKLQKIEKNCQKTSYFYSILAFNSHQLFIKTRLHIL